MEEKNNTFYYQYCPICGQPINNPKDSYTFKDGTKDNCHKQCRLEGLYDYEPWAFFPLMQLFDIPYIEEIWFRKMQHEIKIAMHTHTYTSIFGRYYATMKLFHWKQFGFKDSQQINQWERGLPFTYKPKLLPQTRKILLNNNIPKEYYEIIGLNNTDEEEI